MVNKEVIFQKMRRIYPIETDIVKWYEKENMFLGNKSPKQMVENGKGEIVVDFIKLIGE